MTLKLSIIALCLLTTAAFAWEAKTDSVALSPGCVNMRLVTRIHSEGMFNFSGRMACYNPSIDLNFTAEKNSWGVMIFNAHDLKDPHSSYNFTLALVHRKFKVNERLTIAPHIGLVMEGFGESVNHRDIIITSYRINRFILLEHTGIVANMFQRHDHDWLNRVRMLCTFQKHFDVTASLWHNNHMLDHAGYLSTGLSVFYNRWKIAKRMQGSVGISSLLMAQTSNTEDCPKQNGLMATVGFVIH